MTIHIILTHKNVDSDNAFAVARALLIHELPLTAVKFVGADYGRNHTVKVGEIAVDLSGGEDFLKGEMRDDGRVGSAMKLMDLAHQFRGNAHLFPIPEGVMAVIEQVDAFPYGYMGVFGISPPEEEVDFYLKHDTVFRTSLPGYFLGWKNARSFEVPEGEEYARDLAIIERCQVLIQGMAKLAKGEPVETVSPEQLDAMICKELLKISKIEGSLKVANGRVFVKTNDFSVSSNKGHGRSAMTMLLSAIVDVDRINARTFQEAFMYISEYMCTLYGSTKQVDHPFYEEVSLLALARYWAAAKGLASTEDFVGEIVRGVYGNYFRDQKILGEYKKQKGTRLGEVQYLTQDMLPSMTDAAFRGGAKIVLFSDGGSFGIVRRHDVKVNLLDPKIRQLLETFGEMTRAYHHPSGFCLMYGSRKTDEPTPASKIARSPRLLVTICEVLNKALQEASKKEALDA